MIRLPRSASLRTALLVWLWFCLAMTSAALAAPPTFRLVNIPTRDGLVLKANVFVPAGTGPFAAVVMPSSWGLNDTQYLAQAARWAEDGYVVLSYTPRGWWFSGGSIDTAGPRDVDDIGAVLDWLVLHTPADATRIGMAGISYGAGLSLLGAAHDSRVRAVAAMSGWTDLPGSLYPERTRRTQAAGFLILSAEWVGRPSPELDLAIERLLDNRDLHEVIAWGQVRSPGRYLNQLNRHRPAILLAHSWGDSIFAPDQIVDFHRLLSGPRRLELRPGDHTTPEAFGLVGVPNVAWTSVRRWMDHHLRGEANGVDREPSVHLQPVGSLRTETYPQWSAISSRQARYGLGGYAGWTHRGDLLRGDTRTGWNWTIQAGRDTPAHAGIALISNGLAALGGVPPLVWHPAIPRHRAGVWITPEPARRGGLAIRGAARLQLTIEATRWPTSVFAYLYDTDPIGVARLIAHAPYTLPSAGPRPAHTLQLALPPVAYDVPAGHRLMLVIDTVDALYGDRAAEGSLGFTSPAASPSWLEVPLR